MLHLQKKWGALRPFLILLSLLSFTTGNPHPFELTPNYFPGFTITQNLFPPRISQEVSPTVMGSKSVNEGWKFPGSAFPGFTVRQNLGNKEIFPPPQIVQEDAPGVIRGAFFPGFTLKQNNLVKNFQEVFAEPIVAPTKGFKSGSEGLKIEDAFPGFTLSQNLRNAQTSASPQQNQMIPGLEQDARNKEDLPTPMEGAFYFPTELQSVKQNLDYFPGFTLGQNIGQLFPVAPPQWLDLTGEFPNTLNNMLPSIGKNQKPNFKPSTNPLQITQPHIPYLFPYLFPGHSFPGFSSQNLLQSITPVENSKSSAGVARPLTLEESAESMASSSLEDNQPWDEKEEMLKPIKEAMGLLNNLSSDIQVNASPIVEINQNQSRESFARKDYEIASPEVGKVTIIFQKPNPEAVTADLIKYLEESLGKFKDFSDDIAKEQVLGSVELLSDATAKLEAIVSDALTAEIEESHTNKTKPSKPKTPTRPRPEYGIQSNKNKDQVKPTPRPFIVNLLDPFGVLPNWMVPTMKWPSFINSIQGFPIKLGQSSSSSSPSVRLGIETPSAAGECSNEEAKRMCSPQEEASSCSSFCTKNGFKGGFCFEAERCVCHVDVEKKLGLIFKKSDPVPEPEERIADAKGCVMRCMKSGALTGFCGRGCFCGIPWHDGSLTL